MKPSPSDWAPYTGPGRFGDLDMLVEGYVAFGGSSTPAPSHLLPDEQYTHFSILSLVASPLLMGCNLTQLDQFTQGLFANADVLDVDQDPLGLQATLKTSTNGTSGFQVWSRPLADGSVAVGLFNLSSAAGTVTVNWSDIGVNGTQDVRDLWRQQDLGNYNGSLSATVNSHGVVLVKITPPPRIVRRSLSSQ
jgi:alpha-galactosidase